MVISEFKFDVNVRFYLAPFIPLFLLILQNAPIFRALSDAVTENLTKREVAINVGLIAKPEIFTIILRSFVLVFVI